MQIPYLNVEIIPYTFEQWIELHPEIIEELEQEAETLVICECENGWHECECGDQHLCKRCNGLGFVKKTIDVNKEAKKIYDIQLIRDAKLLEKWVVV